MIREKEAWIADDIGLVGDWSCAVEIVRLNPLESGVTYTHISIVFNSMLLIGVLYFLWEAGRHCSRPISLDARSRMIQIQLQVELGLTAWIEISNDVLHRGLSQHQTPIHPANTTASMCNASC